MKTRLYLILSCFLAPVAGAAPYANFSTNVSGLKLTGWTTTTNPVTARAALGIVTGGDSLWTNNAFGTVSLVDRETNNDFNIDIDGTIHGQADGWSISSAHGVFGGLTLQDQAITPANGLWELPNSGIVFATAFTSDTNRALTVTFPTNAPADGQVITATGTGGATEWRAGGSGQSPWTSDIDGGAFSLTNVGAILVTNNSLTPASVLIGASSPSGYITLRDVADNISTATVTAEGGWVLSGDVSAQIGHFLSLDVGTSSLQITNDVTGTTLIESSAPVVRLTDVGANWMVPLYGDAAGLTNLNGTNLLGVLTNSTSGSAGSINGMQALTNGHTMAVTLSNNLTLAYTNIPKIVFNYTDGTARFTNSTASGYYTDIAGGGITIGGGGLTVAAAGNLYFSTRCSFSSPDNATVNLRNVNGGSYFGSLNVSNVNSIGAVTATNGIVLWGTNAVIKFVASSNTNGPALGANLAYIFAGSNGTAASIYTMDGSGTIKMISEHALPGDAPDSIADEDDPFPNVSKEANYYLGKIRWVNRSRSAKQQELLTKIMLNSMANWMFLQGKTATQWSNSAAYGKYTNSLTKLDELAETSRQLVVNETFEEYRLRTGVSLQQVSWTEVQTRLSNEVFTAYSNALTDYQEAVSAGDTNAVAPGPYVPRTPEPVPNWLYNRGVR